MYTVELMDQALVAAEKLGFGIRQEWLGGVGGGPCTFAGRKWLFVDISLNVVDQLQQVVQALKDDPTVGSLPLSPGLRILLDLPQPAERRVAA